MKKSYIAALLAGVMALSVVTSGCGDNEERKKTSEKNVKDITHSISNTLEQAKKAMRGELEFAYTANANITFGSAISDLTGVELKPVDITTNAKQKGKKTSADMSVNYDSKTLVSINSVIDHENAAMFLKIPELSDAYLTGSKDDIVKLMESQENSLMTNENGMMNSGASVNNTMLNCLKDIDFKMLEDDMKSYVDLIKEKAPEAKEGDKISGEIDGHKYEYNTKTYEINGNDVKTIASAVVDKAKADTFIKDIAISMGATEEEYNSGLDSAKNKIDSMSQEEAKEKLFDLDAYYNGDNLMGIKVNIENSIDINYIVIDEDDVMAVDYMVKSEGYEMSSVGSITEKDGKINGEYNGNMNVDGMSGTFKITMIDVAENDDVFSGTIKCDFNVVQDGITLAPSLVLTSNSTKDKIDMSYSMSINEAEYFTIKITGEKTDASDIKIPDGTMYNITKEDDMERYMSSCDILKFTDNLKSVLGEENFNAFTQSGTDDYYYEDDYYDEYDEDYLFDMNEDLDSEKAA